MGFARLPRLNESDGGQGLGNWELQIGIGKLPCDPDFHTYLYLSGKRSLMDFKTSKQEKNASVISGSKCFPDD